MIRRTMLTLVLVNCFVPAGSPPAAAGDKDAFINGCLKARGATTGECECMYGETQGKLPAEEAAFLIASMGGDTAEIQAAAGKLSPRQRQGVWSSWMGVVDKCLSH